MRKIVAICLVLLLSFNWYGYHIVISLMNENTRNKLETLIDNSEYDESQLIEIKVVLNMPYQQRFTEYERHYGEIEIDGKSYTYVKRKVEGDVVIFKCIADESRQQLKAIHQDLTTANSGADMDQPGKQQSKQSSAAKNILSDYDNKNLFGQLSSPVSEHHPAFVTYSFFIPEVIVNTPHQPPKTASVLS